MGGVWIEYLHGSEPEERNKEREKRWTECFCSTVSNVNKQRHIHQPHENIFSEINSHVVAKELASQIFEKDPDEKEIKSQAPVSQYGNRGDASGKTQKVIFNCTQILGYDSVTDNPS